MEGEIHITNLSDRDSVERLLWSDNQNWRNPPNYNANRDDSIGWIRRVGRYLRSFDDLDEQYLTRFDSDHHEGDNMDDQKEEDAILEYFKARTHHVGVSKDGVNNPTETEEICAICHMEFEHEEIVGTLGCGHEYHTDCIKQWLLRKKICPMCRASAVPFTSAKIIVPMHRI